jgi:hypothetical protein
MKLTEVTGTVILTAADVWQTVKLPADQQARCLAPAGTGLGSDPAPHTTFELMLFEGQFLCPFCYCNDLIIERREP